MGSEAKVKTKKESFGLGVLLTSLWTLVSRCLGLIREMLTSRLFGTSLEKSAFDFAFKLPNLFRRLFGEGALTSALVPVLKEQIDAERYEEAKKLTGNIFAAVATCIGCVVLVAIAGMSIALPFVEEGGYLACIFTYSRIMLPYALFICLAALGMGVLNALSHFGKSAFAQNLLNICWISGLLYLYFCQQSSELYTKLFILSWFILAAGVAQFAYMWWQIRRCGFKFRPRLYRKEFKEGPTYTVCKNLVWGSVGAGVVQINVLIDMLLASLIGGWAISSLGYADRLVYLPMGIIATAMATVILNPLTSAFSTGNIEKANATFRQSFQLLLLLMLPISAILIQYVEDVVILIYKGGEFDNESVMLVSRALMFSSLGLVAFSLNKLIVPWFHARKEVAFTVRITIAQVILNFTLNVLAIIFLPQMWKHAGLALATVISSVVGFMIYLHFAKQEAHGGLESRGLGLLFVRLLLPVVAMCVAMYVVTNYCLPISHLGERVQCLIRLGCASVVGGIVYVIMLYITNRSLMHMLLCRLSNRISFLKRFNKTNKG